MAFISCCTHAQITAGGLSIGGASSKSFLVDLFLGTNGHRLHAGMTYQLGGQKGKSVDEQKSNYGLKSDGSGKYFYTFDFGYSRAIKSRLRLHGEISIGQNMRYTNYIDNRFTSGRYHLITERTTIFGVGADAAYAVQALEFFGGFNSIRGVTAGVRCLLVNK